MLLWRGDEKVCWTLTSSLAFVSSSVPTPTVLCQRLVIWCLCVCVCVCACHFLHYHASSHGPHVFLWMFRTLTLFSVYQDIMLQVPKWKVINQIVFSCGVNVKTDNICYNIFCDSKILLHKASLENVLLIQCCRSHWKIVIKKHYQFSKGKLNSITHIITTVVW